jgi:hypothetical protein
MKTKTQLDFLREAVALAEANLDREIHFCASSDEILEDSAWTSHEISRVEKGLWYNTDEQIFTNLDDVIEHFMLEYEDDDFGEKEAEEMAKEAMKPAILIYTHAS